MDLSVGGEYLVCHPLCRCDGDVGYSVQEVLNFAVASHYLHASHQLFDDDGGDSLLVPPSVPVVKLFRCHTASSAPSGLL